MCVCMSLLPCTVTARSGNRDSRRRTSSISILAPHANASFVFHRFLPLQVLRRSINCESGIEGSRSSSSSSEGTRERKTGKTSFRETGEHSSKIEKSSTLTCQRDLKESENPQISIAESLSASEVPIQGVESDNGRLDSRVKCGVKIWSQSLVLKGDRFETQDSIWL